MKKLLSLILAVVTVVFMIPVAAITSVAAEGDQSADTQAPAPSTDFPFSLNLPTGWVTPRDDMAGEKNNIDANGVTLGSAGQYLQMNTKEGVGVGQKRVLAIDFGIATKVNIIRFSWEKNAGEAQAYNWHDGSDIDLVVCGGPTEPNHGEDAKLCIKMCTGTSYTWQNNGRNYDVAVTKLVNGERVTTTSSMKAWKVDTSTDFMSVLVDGANKGTGTQMVIYFEIDANNKITAIHQKYVYHDAEGNFVSEIVASMPVTLENIVVCDGYLTIGHNGWGDNCALTVKSVSVNAGTYAEMGDSIYSVDFAAWGAQHPNGRNYVTPEKNKEYTDATDTYYKDGYVLHFMAFDKAVDVFSVGYSFANDSFKNGTAEIVKGVLKIANTGADPVNFMLTGNAIPQAITEYTAKYTFRFVGENNSTFGFIRGISLNDSGEAKESASVDLSYNGEVKDFTTADSVWADIVALMRAGEWVDVMVSSVGRYVEYVTISCAGKTATFKMDVDKNKVAVDGYMGFVLGQGTTVEVNSVVVVAGCDSNIQAYSWPTGLEMGALVQNVTADAVAEGTKPDYSDIIDRLNGTKIDDPVDPDNKEPEQSTTTNTEKKKGCKGSIVAVPAIIATAIFGCAVVCKKKED